MTHPSFVSYTSNESEPESTTTYSTQVTEKTHLLSYQADDDEEFLSRKRHKKRSKRTHQLSNDSKHKKRIPCYYIDAELFQQQQITRKWRLEKCVVVIIDFIDVGFLFQHFLRCCCV